MKLLVLNGPNLNLLGEREPELYGSRTYADLVAFCGRTADACGVSVEVRQTNHEGTLVDWIQEARTRFDGVVLNAAAYTHTSVALFDALKAARVRCVEVHLTDPDAREAFRRTSFVRPAAEAVFKGLGFESYAEAIRHFARTPPGRGAGDL
jgi:3-dehydroquinate dehydratase-2